MSEFSGVWAYNPIKEPRGRSRSQSYSQIALLHSHLFLHDQLTFADISGTDKRERRKRERASRTPQVWKSSWTSISKRPVSATSQALFCFRPPWAKPGSYRADR